MSQEGDWPTIPCRFLHGERHDVRHVFIRLIIFSNYPQNILKTFVSFIQK